MGVAVLELRKMHQAQVIAGSSLRVRPSTMSLHLHAELDVLPPSARETNRAPENEDAVGAGPIDRLVIHQHLPEVCWCKPAIRCSSVDLPQPDGPTMQRNSPGLTLRLMLSRAPPVGSRHSSCSSGKCRLSETLGVASDIDCARIGSNTGHGARLPAVGPRAASVLSWNKHRLSALRVSCHWIAFFSFFRQNLVQQRQVVEVRKVRHLLARETRRQRPNSPKSATNCATGS